MSSDAEAHPATDTNGGAACKPVDMSTSTIGVTPKSAGDNSVNDPVIIIKDSVELDPIGSEQDHPDPQTNASKDSKTTENRNTVGKQSRQSRELTPGKRALHEDGPSDGPVSKKTKEEEPTSPRFPSPPHLPATEADKAKWQGYCEIESDPAYFSVILREIGVEGVAVEELHMMDPDDLITRPRIYGLVLLFRHREFDTRNQEPSCPKHVWFANQMPGQNSCATLAMIHTLLNVNDPDIDIGEYMRQFKNFTQDMIPVHRGQTFASWNHVKKIHNSFAKKMDMLENDKYIASKAERAKAAKDKANADAPAKVAGSKETPKPQPQAQSTRDGRRKSNESIDSVEAFEANAHHYIAFVPIAGDVWKLDGMDSQPTLMNSYDEAAGEQWFDALAARINTLIAAGDNDYGIFAITQSPLIRLRKQLCEAENTIKHVADRLTTLNTDWKDFLDADDREPPSPSWLGGISGEQRAAQPIPPSVKAAIDQEGLEKLLHRYGKLCAELRGIVNAYVTEEERVHEEDERAEQRRWDYGPAIAKWLEILAGNGHLEKVMHRFEHDE